MKKWTTGFFVFCSLYCLTFCASQEKFQMEFPQKIESVYFQRWVGGRPESGSGTNFNLKLEQPLDKNIILIHVYFLNQVAEIKPTSNREYFAKFYNPNNNLILDASSSNEYGNSPPNVSKPKFDLKPNEAVLEYRYQSKRRFYKISNIKEKELIAYP